MERIGDFAEKGCSGRDLNPYALGALEPESSVSAIPPPEHSLRTIEQRGWGEGVKFGTGLES